MILPEGIARSEADAPVRVENGTASLDIDRTIFSVNAVLRAAYKFTDRCYIFLQTHGEKADRWVAVLKPKSREHAGEHLLGEFANELVDQQLRDRLEQQFAEVRTLITAQAFAEGNLLDASHEESDYHDDALGVGHLRP